MTEGESEELSFDESGLGVMGVQKAKVEVRGLAAEAGTNKWYRRQARLGHTRNASGSCRGERNQD